MAGIALLSDLLRRSPPAAFSIRPLFPGGVLSATVAASIAGISASRSLISDGGASIAFCDAGVAWKDDYVPDLLGAENNIFTLESIKYSTKQYPIELKPLFSAFGMKSFTIISLRSFLLFYLPLLEPRPVEEDDDFPLESESRTVDLVVPFMKSVKQIVRESTVITTRRVLERLAFHYVSQRMTWKLLKDVSRSAKRKSMRGWSASFFIFSVSRTTLRGQLLGVVANWLVQIGIETYGCLFRKRPDDVDDAETGKMRILGRKITGATFRCCGSLVFASIGAGVGALFYPSIGQWTGCAIGDFGGPIIVTALFKQYLHLSI